MTTYVAFLQGVNVGARRMKMADLREACAALGLENVRTHLQSGNIVFDSEDDPAALAASIEEAVRERFGFHSETVVLPVAALDAVIARNPFPADATPNPSWLVVMFAKSPPDAEAIERFARGYPGAERIRVRDGVVYIYYAEGIGRSKLGAALGKAKVAISGTARNMNVVRALADLARS